MHSAEKERQSRRPSLGHQLHLSLSVWQPRMQSATARLSPRVHTPSSVYTSIKQPTMVWNWINSMIRDRIYRIYASHCGQRNIHTAYAGLAMSCNEVAFPWFTSPTLGQLWDRPSASDVLLTNTGNLVTSTDSRWYNHNDRTLQDKIRAHREMSSMRNIDGLVQDGSNSIANALELPQSYTKPSISSQYNATQNNTVYYITQ